MLTAGDSEAERGGDYLSARSACHSPHRRIQVMFPFLSTLPVTLNDIKLTTTV